MFTTRFIASSSCTMTHHDNDDAIDNLMFMMTIMIMRLNLRPSFKRGQIGQHVHDGPIHVPRARTRACACARTHARALLMISDPRPHRMVSKWAQWNLRQVPSHLMRPN